MKPVSDNHMGKVSSVTFVSKAELSYGILHVSALLASQCKRWSLAGPSLVLGKKWVLYSIFGLLLIPCSVFSVSVSVFCLITSE